MRKYNGIYGKTTYKIKLKKTGEIIERTWPNAGVFHDLDSGRIIDGAEVDEVEALELDLDD